jgi:hypothetical protein
MNNFIELKPDVHPKNPVPFPIEQCTDASCMGKTESTITIVGRPMPNTI